MVFNATFNNISVISWLSCFIGGVYWEKKSKSLQTTDAKWEQYVIWPLHSWSELLHT
jgi:hypothetical protein